MVQSSDERIQLSILDLATMYAGETANEAMQNSTELAQLADRLGYTRYWFAEHHNSKQQLSTSPEILIAHAAAHTNKIRVGSGGVMLPNHSSLKVAEDFSVLEALHPGRIDLGIGRAPGTDRRTAWALRRSREAVAIDEFPEQLNDLLSYFTRQFPSDHPFKHITPSPEPDLIPRLFMLGSSDGGMRFAVHHGLGFAFAAHINPRLSIPILRAYRENFRPSSFWAQPQSILALGVITADTEEEAWIQAGPALLQWVRWGKGEFGLPFPTVEEARAYEYTPEDQQVLEENADRFVIGSVEQVKQKLLELVRASLVDEVMILSMVTEKEARHRSFELLAEAFQLQ